MACGSTLVDPRIAFSFSFLFCFTLYRPLSSPGKGRVSSLTTGLKHQGRVQLTGISLPPFVCFLFLNSSHCVGKRNALTVPESMFVWVHAKKSIR